MPLSKVRNRIRMRRERAKRAMLLGEAGYWRRKVGELRRELEAKRARVEWQSWGIRMLQEEVATLKARIATMPAMQELELAQRLTQHEAEHIIQESYGISQT